MRFTPAIFASAPTYTTSTVYSTSTYTVSTCGPSRAPLPPFTQCMAPPATLHGELDLQSSPAHTSSLALPSLKRPVPSSLALVPSLPCSCKCLPVKRPGFRPDLFMISLSGYGFA
ncbi:hypothetical protein EJ08DRAFT_89864 [Tothia fuscella]|uniref:Uncharacterized protein n=1 Tax=Tothia fuscella TaxID=1048955 RepID=A0A9P4NWX4_9PEZI|nr:hypothetical protein EJ08DRAFT_89864 [Tothia fuscella]